MAAREGQLDQISEAIGRLAGQLEALDRYTHDREHGINNLAQKVDGIGVQIAREVARLKGELQADLSALKSDISGLDDRVAALEAQQERQAGAKSALLTILQSPVLAWVFALAVILWSALTGKVK